MKNEKFKQNIVMVISILLILAASLECCSKGFKAKTKQEFLRWQYSE